MVLPSNGFGAEAADLPRRTDDPRLHLNPHPGAGDGLFLLREWQIRQAERVWVSATLRSQHLLKTQLLYPLEKNMNLTPG